MPFVKLDCGILDSSLWGEPLETRIVFITMLAMSNANGLVESTAPGIARRANLPLESVRIALDSLSSPDPYSRTIAEEGRRIVRVDGGYRLVAYSTYREKEYRREPSASANDSRRYVYFGAANGKIKIGFSSNPWARANELAVGAGPIKIIGTFRGTRDDESSWHKRFDHLRIHGEWFKPDPSLLSAIKAACGDNYVATERYVAPEAEAEAFTDAVSAEAAPHADERLGIKSQEVRRLADELSAKLPFGRQETDRQLLMKLAYLLANNLIDRQRVLNCIEAQKLLRRPPSKPMAYLTKQLYAEFGRNEFRYLIDQAPKPRAIRERMASV